MPLPSLNPFPFWSPAADLFFASPLRRVQRSVVEGVGSNLPLRSKSTRLSTTSASHGSCSDSLALPLRHRAARAKQNRRTHNTEVVRSLDQAPASHTSISAPTGSGLPGSVAALGGSSSLSGGSTIPPLALRRPKRQKTAAAAPVPAAAAIIAGIEERRAGKRSVAAPIISTGWGH